MRVLHLPTNNASQIQIMVSALRTLGVEARGLITRDPVIQSCEGLEVLPSFEYGGKWDRIRRLNVHAKRLRKVLSAIRWADILHYHYGGAFALPRRLDARWARLLGKPRIVTFCGTDIRIPEVEAAGNPFYGSNMGFYGQLKGSSRERSLKIQQEYKRLGFRCSVRGEMMVPHVREGPFSDFYFVPRSVDMQAVEPSYPDPDKQTPLVVHSPSDPVLKGTESVVASVLRLKRQGIVDFEFVLLQGRRRQEALDILRKADIFLDQFVVCGYGVAAIEAMAMGKPVVCYINPEWRDSFPDDLPIVQADQCNLSDVLASLLRDGKSRHNLGRKCRRYAEEHHDALTNARKWLSIYEDLLSSKKVEVT